MTVFQCAPITRKAGPHGALFGGAVRCALYGIGLLSAAINVLALTGALFMLQIYDRVLPSGSLPTLVVLSLLAAALFVIYGLLDLVGGRVLVRLSAWLDAAVSPRVYQALVRQG
jgi:ABC-type protease/lipase transport system fused ATPase/permease subunit